MDEYIRKQDALNAIKNSELGLEYDEVEAVPCINIRESPKGNWIRSRPFAILLKNCVDSVRCPFCGAHINERVGELWRFCPGCGAEMTGEQHD